MKWLVWALLLLNAGLFGYFNADKISPKAATAVPEINPQKLKVLNEEALQAMPKKESVVPAAPIPAAPAAAPASVGDASASDQAKACYKWTNLGPSNLPSAQVELVKLGLQATVISEALNPQGKFWVYYPPLKTPELARKKADEIKALGVDELYIVQDSQWRNAISFGLFNDEQLATNLLNALHDKGVRGATKGLHTSGVSALLIKDVTPNIALELHKIKPEFVGTELAPSAC